MIHPIQDVKIFVLLAVLMLTMQEARSSPAHVPPQHVIVIVVDSLRADHLGCFGYKRDTSPFIDTLATESVFFEHAYSQSSFTAESVLSLFYGLYPSSNPWGTGHYANTNPNLSDLAKLFAAGGYYTGYFSNNPTINETDLHKSFAEYEFTASKFEGNESGPKLTQRCLRFVTEKISQKTFTYLHYLGPHWPYDPPEEYYLRFASEKYPTPLRLIEDIRPNVAELVADGFGPGDARFEDVLIRYDGEIAFEDTAIKTLYDGLRTLGILDQTLIVFTADHGEEFLDHGFVEHAWSLFPESIHVPLFFRMPSLLPPVRIKAPVGLVDVFPTLLNLAGLPPAEYNLDGSSLFFLDNDSWAAKPDNGPLVSELLLSARNMIRTVVQDNYLYIAAPKCMTPAECSTLARDGSKVRIELITGVRPEPDAWGTPQYEALFNLETDPFAKDNILVKYPDICAQMRDFLNIFKGKCPQQISNRHKICRMPKMLVPPIQQFLEEHGYLKPIETPDSVQKENEEKISGLGYL
jgi:arylsulfatase A-like enzyme